MSRSDAYRLQRIVELGSLLLETMEEEGVTRESLAADYRQQWLVSTPLYNIGEQAYCISKEFREAHPDVEWAGISGLRHRLVHDYEGTNWRLISSIVFDELPCLVERAEALLREVDRE